MALGLSLSALKEEITHLVDPKTNQILGTSHKGIGIARLATSNALAEVSYNGRPLSMLLPYPTFSDWEISLTHGERNFYVDLTDSKQNIDIQDRHNGSVQFNPDQRYIVVNIQPGTIVDIKTYRADVPIIFNIVT